jgi:hypothetical protein
VYTDLAGLDPRRDAMGFEQVVQNYVTNIGRFALNNLSRLTSARVNLQKGTYGADQLASDTAQTWIEGLDAIWSIVPDVGSPVVPTIVIPVVAAAPAKGSAQAYLAGSVPIDAANMVVSDLTQLGVNVVIPAASLTLASRGFTLTVTFTPPAGIVAGLYEAVVATTGWGQVLALVIVKVI